MVCEVCGMLLLFLTVEDKDRVLAVPTESRYGAPIGLVAGIVVTGVVGLIIFIDCATPGRTSGVRTAGHRLAATSIPLGVQP